MILQILTPDKQVYSGAVQSVKVPGVLGQFEVLENHAPIVSALGEGEVRLITEHGDTIRYTIVEGFIEVLNNEVALLVRGLQAVS